MEKEPRILGEETISQQGSFKRVRRWLEGHHPELGMLTTQGYTGNETIQEVDVIEPVATVNVIPKLTVGESGQIYVNEEVFDAILGRNTQRIVGLWEGEDPSGSDTAQEQNESSN